MSELLYKNLFTPFKLRGITVPNRIMSAPNMLLHTVDGRPTDYYIRYIEHKARGGAGIVNLGEVPACDGACHTTCFQNIEDNLPLIGEIAQVIHEHGAIASAEITHGGMSARAIRNKDPNRIVGPVSGVNAFGETIREMTPDDMEYVAEGFANTAAFYLHAGFDTLHLHYGHGWLFSQFFSPIINKRKDEYGGSLENRMRFPLMVLRRVRERIGSRPPLMIRLSGSERVPGGFTTEDMTAFLSIAQEYIDLAEISTEGFQHVFATTYQPYAQNLELCESIKNSNRINIPLYTVGSIVSPDLAEDIIVSGKADGVSMSRALIADPYLPKKSRTGRTDEITPCLRCLKCTGSDNFNRHFVCSVNPRIGREERIGFADSLPKKSEYYEKVLIVGGGPAGMEAAVTASERGHYVTLIEKADSLGGWLRFTEKDDLKKDLRRFTQYLINRTKKSDINIMLNTELSDEIINKIKPDRIIFATGSVPAVPPLPGIETAKHATAAYFEPDCIGQKIVIIGGGLVGIEVGLYLAEQGRNVTVVELLNDYASEAGGQVKAILTELAVNYGMKIETGVCVQSIAPGRVSAETKTYDCDTVLYAVGMRPNDAPYFEYFDRANMSALIGDAKKPGQVDGAIHTGFFAAMDI